MTTEPGATIDLSSLKGQKVVDARGTSCPGPILAAKKGMAEVKVGEIMEVLATDSGTPEGPARLGQEGGARTSVSWTNPAT